MADIAKKPTLYSENERNGIDKWLLIWPSLILICVSAWVILFILHHPARHTESHMTGTGSHDSFLGSFLDVLTAAHVHHGLMNTLILWIAMVPAMMFPSAVPVIKDYLDIARMARGKDFGTFYAIAPPFFLIIGYGTAWMLFALPAALLQYELNHHFADLLSNPTATVTLIMIAALWQLSPLKTICAVKCKTGFPFIFGGWSDRPRKAFEIGLRYGVWCIGCCWALMILMFAGGVMSLLMMAILTFIMAAEHLFLHKKWQCRAIGVGLIVAAFYIFFDGFGLA